MARKIIAPTIEKGQLGDKTYDVHRHPAFGSIVLSRVSSGGTQLFGSDVGHMGYVRIEIRRAEMHRDLSHDTISPNRQSPVAIIEMTHTQFAEFITSAGRGEGTPVTLRYVSETPAVAVPEIAPIASKQDILRKEIREAAKSHLEGMRKETERLATIVESGRFNKKELRELVTNLQRHVEQAPGSLDFVVRSAEEALEAATTSARIEVEAFVADKAKSLGLENLSQLATESSPRALPGAAHTGTDSSSEDAVAD